jgi:hypothetical protein
MAVILVRGSDGIEVHGDKGNRSAAAKAALVVVGERGDGRATAMEA